MSDECAVETSAGADSSGQAPPSGVEERMTQGFAQKAGQILLGLSVLCVLLAGGCGGIVFLENIELQVDLESAKKEQIELESYKRLVIVYDDFARRVLLSKTNVIEIPSGGGTHLFNSNECNLDNRLADNGEDTRSTTMAQIAQAGATASKMELTAALWKKLVDEKVSAIGVFKPWFLDYSEADQEALREQAIASFGCKQVGDSNTYVQFWKPVSIPTGENDDSERGTSE